MKAMRLFFGIFTAVGLGLLIGGVFALQHTRHFLATAIAYLFGHRPQWSPQAAIGKTVDELADSGLAGTPDEVAKKIGKFAELGAEHMYLQVLDLHDLDHLELIAAEVMPRVI